VASATINYVIGGLVAFPFLRCYLAAAVVDRSLPGLGNAATGRTTKRMGRRFVSSVWVASAAHTNIIDNICRRAGRHSNVWVANAIIRATRFHTNIGAATRTVRAIALYCSPLRYV